MSNTDPSKISFPANSLGKTLSIVRSFVRRVLHLAPTLRIKVVEPAYNVIRTKLDGRFVLRNYPSAIIRNYPPKLLAEFRVQGYHSQLGQDRYLEEYLKVSQNPGFFVEIGANHPIKDNNSFFLEQNGWQGVSFDAQTSFAKEWREHRKTPFQNVAIGESSGTRAFVQFKSVRGWEHLLSAFKEYAHPGDMAEYEYEEIEVSCAPLSELLPLDRTVDLLMIDVEGAEQEVLKGIDFEKIRPAYILIENVKEIGGDMTLRAMIERYGYTLVARIGATDDLFMLKS